MRPFLILLIALIGLNAHSAFAGGVQCKACPSENDACLPRPDCDEQTGLSLFEAAGSAMVTPWSGPDWDSAEVAKSNSQRKADEICQHEASRLSDFLVQSKACGHFCRTVTARATYTCD